MDTIEIKTAAKINLSLDILGIRGDGYHELDMIVCPVSLYDHIRISKRDQGIALHCDGDLPNDEDNIAYRAAQIILDQSELDTGVDITIQKHIPAQAGLGGGSSDAAAVLYGINELYHLDLSIDKLKELGISLGADVPLFLSQSVVRARGIGERLEDIVLKESLYLVIIKPEAGLSTAEVYHKYDHLAEVKHILTAQLTRALGAGDLDEIAKCMGNVMETAAIGLCPEVKRAIVDLEAAGALVAQMSGSGSAVFGIFKDKAAAQQAQSALSASWLFCIQASTLDKSINIL